MIVELDADPRCPAVDDEIDAAAEVGLHVRGRGRRHMAGAVCRRRHHRPVERRENIAGDGMIGNAHRDAVETGRRQRRHRAIGGLGKDERQRPRPEGLGEPRRIGIKSRQCLRRRAIDNSRDQRIERRPALGLVDARDRPPRGRIGAEAIDRLGGESDQPAGGKDARRLGHRAGIGRQNARRQRGCHRSHLVIK